MVEIKTLIMEHKDIIIERDARITEATETINKEYDDKLKEHKKHMHKELDTQLKGL